MVYINFRLQSVVLSANKYLLWCSINCRVIIDWLSGEGQPNDQAARHFSRNEVSPQVSGVPYNVHTLILSNPASEICGLMRCTRTAQDGRSMFARRVDGFSKMLEDRIPRTLRIDEDLTFCICQIQLRTAGSSNLECLWVGYRLIHHTIAP